VVQGAPPDDSRVDVPTTAVETGEAYVRENSSRPSSILGIIDIGADFTSDWPAFFMFLAMVNVFIGVLNLIPLLPFDGGHVAVACYERVRELIRRDGRRYLVDAKRLMPIVYAVVIVLGTVGGLAIIADITQPLQI
jgi:membrane-associated protease RseP (regulator of RpoE activity)